MFLLSFAKQTTDVKKYEKEPKRIAYIPKRIAYTSAKKPRFEDKSIEKNFSPL
jgi:hypothetical protein